MPNDWLDDAAYQAFLESDEVRRVFPSRGGAVVAQKRIANGKLTDVRFSFIIDERRRTGEGQSETGTPR